MLKCWNYSAEQRPNFRYCLETLKALQSKTNNYSKITTQFTADGFKYWSSSSATGSSGLHSGLSSGIPLRTGQVFRPIEPVTNNTNSINVAKPTVGIPKYLELMYDESQDSNSEQSLAISPTHQMVPQIPVGVVKPNARELQALSQRSSLALRPNDGYEIPINGFEETGRAKNSASRSNSNSSTMPSMDPEEIRISLELALQSMPNRNSHPISLGIGGKQASNKLLNDSHSNESLMQRNVA